MRAPATIHSAAQWLLPLLALGLILTAIVAAVGLLPAGMQRVATDALIKLLVVVG